MKKSLALSVCLGLAASANASIISTTGSATQIVAPASAMPGALTAGNAWAWNEQINASVLGMPVDMSTNPSTSNAPVAGSLSTFVDSHFIHFDGLPGSIIFGTVTFATNIIGVQYNDSFLDMSDVLGVGTTYPTFSPGRGFQNYSGADYLRVNANVLTFEMTAPGLPHLNQVRVFTVATPAPGSAALLGLGGLVAVRRRRADA